MSLHLSMNQVSQGLHFTLGALGVIFAAYLGLRFECLNAYLYGLIATLFIAAIKEIWDVFYEDPLTSGGWKGSLQDWSFYCLGAVIALGLVVYI